ncbi:MAG: VWA domain-containing protein [Verrucomicrobiota bacterium]|jgi:Ca-activated chloride channel family protein|nr:VWA domain-containing protein [Verrucomicrobiota bacterium]
MNSFTFAEPAWLWLLLLLPLAGWLKGATGAPPAVIYSSLALVRRFQKIAPQKAGRFLWLLRWLALTGFILALARPQWGEGKQRIRASGIDIVVSMDLSDSMLAEDFERLGRDSNRLDVSKEVLEEFINGRPSDRIGLIAFSGKAYIASPPTLNHSFLLENLDRFTTETVPEEGTAIGSGISAAINRLREIKDSKSRIVILMTDGEENTGKIKGHEAATAAAAIGIKIYTIGIGKDGTMLYLPDQFGFKRPVQLVGIDEDSLREIALKTGGKYFRAESTEALRAVYKEIDQLEKTEREEQRYLQYHDLFRTFLGISLGLLVLDLILNYTLLRRLP